jgi:hypothetical protein
LGHDHRSTTANDKATNTRASGAVIGKLSMSAVQQGAPRYSLRAAQIATYDFRL